MARPVKETPVLRGQDAVNFLNKINKNPSFKLSQESKEKIRRDYEAIKAIERF